MARVPTHRVPTHPGEMLRLEFIEPLGVTQRELAEAIGVPYQRINELVNGKRGVTPSTALRLGRFLGTSAELWLSLQIRWELYWTNRKEGDEIERIERSQKIPESLAA